MHHNVRAERELGIDARGLTVDYSTRLDNRGLSVWPRKWMMSPAALVEIAKSDVVVWYGATPMYGFERIKPGVAIFNGAELRTPEAEADNSWFRQGEYPVPDPVKVLRRFAGWDILAENPSVFQYSGGWYFGRGIFPPDNAVWDGGYDVHVGSQRITKGTVNVLASVPDIVVLHGISHDECMIRVSGCRVYVGQFGLGDLGIAEMEAMYLGKPVVSWVKPSLLPHYPGLPIVNVDAAQLAGAVEWLRRDEASRKRIGKECRDYAYENFDPLAASERRASLYEFGPS